MEYRLLRVGSWGSGDYHVINFLNFRVNKSSLSHTVCCKNNF